MKRSILTSLFIGIVLTLISGFYKVATTCDISEAPCGFMPSNPRGLPLYWISDSYTDLADRGFYPVLFVLNVIFWFFVVLIVIQLVRLVKRKADKKISGEDKL